MSAAGGWQLMVGGLLVLAACASAPERPLPAYMASATTADHPKYPAVRYLTAVGVSSHSFEDAAARAAAEIAAQISAQVQAETRSFAQFVAGSGESERVTQSISVRTAWKHAQLIRAVEREERGSTWYVYSAMERAAADEAVARDVEPDQQRFELAVRTALDARQAGRAGDFASAARDAKAVQAAVEASWILRRAVLGRPAAGEIEYRDARTAFERALAEARARRVVDVVLRGAIGDQRLVEYAMKSVRGLGIRQIETKGCEARKESNEHLLDATELVVEPREVCTQVSLGEKCEVQAQFVARGCASGGVGAGAVATKGMHPSDEDKARKAAWGKVTYQAVDAAVRDALKGAVAIGAEE